MHLKESGSVTINVDGEDFVMNEDDFIIAYKSAGGLQHAMTRDLPFLYLLY